MDCGISSATMRGHTESSCTGRGPSQSSRSSLISNSSYSSIDVTNDRRVSEDSPTRILPYSGDRTSRRLSNGYVPMNINTTTPSGYIPSRKPEFNLQPISTGRVEPIAETAVSPPESDSDQRDGNSTALKQVEPSRQRFKFPDQGQRFVRNWSDSDTCSYCSSACNSRRQRCRQGTLTRNSQSCDILDAEGYDETYDGVQKYRSNTIRTSRARVRVGEEESLRTISVSTSTSDKESQQPNSFVSKRILAIAIIGVCLINVLISTCVTIGLPYLTPVFNQENEHLHRDLQQFQRIVGARYDEKHLREFILNVSTFLSFTFNTAIHSLNPIIFVYLNF